MTSRADAHRELEAAAVAELVAERVGQLVQWSSINGYAPRDPIMVIEAMLAHLLNYVGSEIVIRENPHGPGLVVTHTCWRANLDQSDSLAVVAVGQFAFTSALTNVFAQRDDVGDPEYFGEVPF